jgi:hypothetical protein
MPRKSRSQKLHPSKTPRPLSPLDCPSDLSLYEWESQMAEEKLAAERKGEKQRERYLNHILSASADCGKLGA